MGSVMPGSLAGLGIAQVERTGFEVADWSPRANTMKVGYCVPVAPQMASYRLRVAIPAPLMGCEYEIGATGNPTFFYKHTEADQELARSCGPYVFDVVNNHFDGKLGAHYRAMCDGAAAITVSSPLMAGTVSRYTRRTATIIDDPYENDEQEARCAGQEVLWFGHSANISSLFDIVPKILPCPIVLTVCTNYKHPATVPWTPETERRSLDRCALVLATGNNPGASGNRIAKALRAGRFVVTPGGVPAWDAYKDYIWIGDVRKGIEWAFKNRSEVAQKVKAGQAYVREASDPRRIARQWTEVFASILPPVISVKKAGSRLTLPTATAMR